MEYDYIVLSFGPHLQAVIDNPYTTSSGPTTITSVKELFELTAAALTQRLTKLYNSKNVTKTPLLIYRSGHVGVKNYTRNCDEKPLDMVPDIADDYEWPLIPLVNDIYTKSICNAFADLLSRPSKQIPSPLIMDTSALMSKITGCRADFMHFKLGGSSSPVNLELQILQNLLMEYHISLSQLVSESITYTEQNDIIDFLYMKYMPLLALLTAAVVSLSGIVILRQRSTCSSKILQYLS